MGALLFAYFEAWGVELEHKNSGTSEEYWVPNYFAVKLELYDHMKSDFYSETFTPTLKPPGPRLRMYPSALCQCFLRSIHRAL